jgi:hypothetical protein
VNRIPVWVVLLAVLLLSACVLNRRTHHSSIDVWLPERDRSSQSAVAADLAEVQRILDAWAAEHGFVRTTGHHRLSMSSTDPAAEIVAVYYTEKDANDPKWPIEVMVACDLHADPPLVKVASSEGYGRRPTAKLAATHEELLRRLKDRFGDAVKGAIW